MVHAVPRQPFDGNGVAIHLMMTQKRGDFRCSSKGSEGRQRSAGQCDLHAVQRSVVTENGVNGIAKSGLESLAFNVRRMSCVFGRFAGT
jgi:hypothetical protein